MDTDQQSQPIQRNSKSKTADYITAHGRRKEAVANIRLFKGKGEFTVNGQPIDNYLTLEVSKLLLQKPFLITKTQGQYYATIKVEGSGKNSQLGAIIHGLSRALSVADPQFRPILKKAGLLTRDPRAKERRKYGRAQKARKGKQSPKR